MNKQIKKRLKERYEKYMRNKILESFALCLCLVGAIVFVSIMYKTSSKENNIDIEETDLSINDDVDKLNKNVIKVAESKKEEIKETIVETEEIVEVETEPYVEYQEEYYQEVYVEPVTEPEYYPNGSGLNPVSGVNYYNGWKETYYSSNVLYHYRTPEWTVDSNGVYRDAEGYVIVASSSDAQGDVVDTSFGLGKVYDTGCAYGTHDIYTNW